MTFTGGTDEQWTKVNAASSEVEPEVPKEEASQHGTAPAVNIRPGDIVIALMGITGSGKSTFISHFAKNVVIGHSLDSCTSNVGIYECAYDSNTKIFFVDTPGFDDTYKSDTDILREIADWLSQAYGNNIKLTGIIYLHRILDVRVGGSAMKNLRMFKKLCGDDALSSVVLATTWWSSVDPATGAKRETDLTTRESFWAGMIAKGSRVFRQDNGVQSARHIVDYLVQLKRPVTLKIQKELVDDKKKLDETGAGVEVDSQLKAQRKEFEAKLLQLQLDMQQAMEEKDTEYQEELNELRRETENNMRKAEENRQKLQADAEELRRQKDQELADERLRAVQDRQANIERAMQFEHELKVLSMTNTNALAQQRLTFEMEKEKAERLRLEKVLREKDEGCTVM